MGEPETELQVFLRSPPDEVALTDLPGRFPHAVIRILVPGAGELAFDPAAPGRVRGALGGALKVGASLSARVGRVCDWSPPCALDVLFRSQGMMTPGLEIPKPFTLALSAEGADLRICCRLFGLAADWAGEVADGLVRALRGGISGQGGGKFNVSHRTTTWAPGNSAWPTLSKAAPSAIQLVFETPFVLREGANAHARLPALVTGIGNRVSGLSRWMGLSVDADWHTLRNAASAITYEMDLVETGWTRGSKRQSRTIGVTAFAGRVRLSGNLVPLLPLLALGELTHAGAHAALGLGRFRLE